MKTLSIKQPWANLIAHGLKDIENRTWRTNFRGRILIHAPIKRDNVTFTSRQIMETDKNYNYDNPCFCSAIIGSVEIVDCIQDSDSIWAEKDCWHWVLKDPVLFDEPILNVKGKLSLWEYDLSS